MSEIILVINGFVASERHVVAAFLVKTTKAVITRPIQIIKKLGGYQPRGRIPIQSVKGVTAFVVDLFIVDHFDVNGQPLLEVLIRIDQGRIEIIEQSPLRI